MFAYHPRTAKRSTKRTDIASLGLWARHWGVAIERWVTWIGFAVNEQIVCHELNVIHLRTVIAPNWRCSESFETAE